MRNFEKITGPILLNANISGKLLLESVTYSYPRLTLDFHTNKRIIDEVVSIHYLLEEVLITNLFSVICYN